MQSDRKLEDGAGKVGRDQILQRFGGQVEGVSLFT